VSIHGRKDPKATIATAPARRRFAGSGLRRVRAALLAVAAVMGGLYGTVR
jgi:hypothetical protein